MNSNPHKMALRFIKENIAITDKFHKDLVAERALMASDTWTIDFMIRDVENWQQDLLEALSEALHFIADGDPKKLINPQL